MRSPTSIAILLVIQVSFISVEASVRPEIAALVVPKATVGAGATLVCTSNAGTNPVQFHWTKDGKDIASNLIVHHPSAGYSTVVMTSVKTDDRGRYSCLVKNAFGEDSRSADLIVTGQSIPSLL